MKVYNEKTSNTQTLANYLEDYRTKRNFQVNEWINSKVNLINAYFSQNKLSAAVIGVSGGIDSAVALSLVKKASMYPQSSIQKIIPLLLPSLNFEGATEQEKSIAQAQELCDSLNCEPVVFSELTHVSSIISNELEKILKLPATGWTKGQLVAYARTPIIYNTCSFLTEHGNPALVIGTTNLSEGGYLGYVGKASDGMVDLQIISDIYKSEVYQVAEKLNIPESIISAVPTGDMYDGRDDETVFGASYDSVELFHLWLQNGSPVEILDSKEFRQISDNLGKLHNYNKHKYTYATPSIHLDLMNSVIPGGWNNTPWRPSK